MSRKGSGGKKKTSLPAFGFADDLLKGGREGGAQEDDKAGESKAGESKAGESGSQKPSSLPAYGFAEDLLDKSKGDHSRAAAAEPKGAAPHEKEEKSSAVASPEPADEKKKPGGKGQAGRAAQRGVARDENRIFAFADSLEAETEEESKKLVTLETWVTFTLAGETFAMPVEPVREILRISTITRVPHAPHPIRGVTNLRGRVIPVIDLRVRIELEEGKLTKASRIIVVGSRNRLLGLLVDGVHQVVHLDVDRIQPPPEDVMTIQSDYISGVYQADDQLLLLLDVDRALIIRDAAAPAEALGREAGDSPAAAAEA